MQPFPKVTTIERNNNVYNIVDVKNPAPVGNR